MENTYLICEEKGTNSGFTLVELMMTLFISIFIAATIYVAYTGQHTTQIAQNDLIQIQQNIRAASNLLSSEMRLAGYKDPSSDTDVGLSTSTSDVNQGKMRFIWEDDSGTTSDITYKIDNTADADGDGVIDDLSVAGNLQRTINGGTDTIIENVVALEFLYILEDETDNSIYDPITTITPTSAELKKIRAVTLSILARGDRVSRDKVKGPASYTTGSGAVVAVDNDYRHRLLISTVQLRNIGL